MSLTGHHVVSLVTIGEIVIVAIMAIGLRPVRGEPGSTKELSVVRDLIITGRRSGVWVRNLRVKWPKLVHQKTLSIYPLTRGLYN